MSHNMSSVLTSSLKIPYFETMQELSELTRLSPRLLYCLSKKTKNYYRTNFIPKKNGKLKEISIPSYTLHIVQRWILVKILNKLLPSDYAMAFRKGEKYGHKQNAYYHAGTLYGLSIDLEDFFPTITSNKVYTIFADLGYNKFAATVLTNLCTLDGKLPQGSACSPAISNLICLTLDKRLIGLCQKRGIRYSRYADDMYFSCDDKILLLKAFPVILKIVEDEGFVPNEKKIHFHTPANKKQITGITVVATHSENYIELKAPRKLKQKIRAEIFTCFMSGKYDNRNHILGEINYVDFIERENKLGYLERIKHYIEKQVTKIELFPELVLAYNSNKFFKDLPDAELKEIDIDTEEKWIFLSDIFEERKRFLQEKGLKDVCQYTNWPETIVHVSSNFSGDSIDSESPFE